MGQSHVLVHPSLHDSGGWVCLEAMAAKRPVICLDLGGPAIQVTNKTGIKVPAHNPRQTIAELKAAMEHLAANPQLRLAMGEAGHQLICDQFSLEGMGQNLNQVYAELVPAVQ